MDRYNYLKLDSKIGDITFGFERYLNQTFYKTKEWRKVRDFVINRDNGCDLGIEGREIFGRAYVHHINPIDPKDIYARNLSVLLNPDNLITTTHATHMAIHYGDESSIEELPLERSKNDTCPWKE